jgi:hypothetical protein
MANGKMKLGDFLTDIAAPAAAVIASTYGPRYAGAAAIGMRAVEGLQENKRRQNLGREVAKLADQRAEEDLRARRETHNKAKNVATALTGDEAAAASMLQTFGIQNPIGSGAVKSQRTDEFLKKMPEPVRDEAYSMVGSVAEAGDPEAAISMLRDQDRFRQNVAMKAADQIFKEDQYRREAADRMMRTRLQVHLDEKRQKQIQDNADRSFGLQQETLSETRRNHDLINQYRSDALLAQGGMAEDKARAKELSDIDKKVYDIQLGIASGEYTDGPEVQQMLLGLQMRKATLSGAQYFKLPSGEIISLSGGVPGSGPAENTEGATTSQGQPTPTMHDMAMARFAEVDAGLSGPGPSPQRLNEVVAQQGSTPSPVEEIPIKKQDPRNDIKESLLLAQGGNSMAPTDMKVAVAELMNRGYDSDRAQRMIAEYLSEIKTAQPERLLELLDPVADTWNSLEGTMPRVPWAKGNRR